MEKLVVPSHHRSSGVLRTRGRHSPRSQSHTVNSGGKHAEGI